MELWIRSQDKEKLLKVNDIAIEINMIYGYFDKNTEYEHLGTYATKERALEILDEIQKIFSNGLQANNNNQISGTTTYVYQMPKE